MPKPAIDPEELVEAIENLVDRSNVINVLVALVQVCEIKGESSEEATEAESWFNDAEIIGKMANEVEN